MINLTLKSIALTLSVIYAFIPGSGSVIAQNLSGPYSAPRIIYNSSGDEKENTQSMNLDIFWCSGDVNSFERALSASELAASYGMIVKYESLRDATEINSTKIPPVIIRTRPLDKNSYKETLNVTDASVSSKTAMLRYDNTDVLSKLFVERIVKNGNRNVAEFSNNENRYSPNYVSIYICTEIDASSIGSRLYFQANNRSGKEKSSVAAGRLRSDFPGLTVAREIEIVGQKSPLKSEVRFFFHEDALIASQIADSISQSMASEIGTRYVAGYEKKLRRGSLEAWITDSAESPIVDNSDYIANAANTGMVETVALQTVDYANTRYSKIDQINVDNVKSLQVAWTFSTGVLRGHEGSPLVVGGIMYVHTPFPNIVYALDLNQGAKIVWKYEPKQDPSIIELMCCDTVNRGLAYADGAILMQQADTTLVSLDARSGKVNWSVKNGDPAKGETNIATVLPVKDKVIVGISGGEFGVNCHVTAYDLKSGKKLWRGYSQGSDTDMIINPKNTTSLGKPVGKDSSLKTWEESTWKTGGGCTEGWFSYDPKLDLFYYGSGNASALDKKQRSTDKKWSMTIWARNPDTGMAKWVYQMTPHTERDNIGTNEMILTERTISSKIRKVLTHFSNDGFVYTFDRETGELLAAEKYDHALSWATSVDMNRDSKNYGRPITVSKYATSQNAEGSTQDDICHEIIVAKGSQPAAYSQDTHLFYVPVSNICNDKNEIIVNYPAGMPYRYKERATKFVPDSNGQIGRFIALDAFNGKVSWLLPERFNLGSGVLATGGGLVFYGTLDGYLKAVDAKSGKELYKFKTPSGIVGNVTSFVHGGKQYIAVLSGVGGLASPESGTNNVIPPLPRQPKNSYDKPDLSAYTNLGGTLMVFSLKD